MSITMKKVSKEEAESWGGRYGDTATLDEIKQDIIDEKRFIAEEKKLIAKEQKLSQKSTIKKINNQ